MKICVLNGSPKGEDSISLQYARFIQKKFPDNEYVYLHIAQTINKIENDAKIFQSIMNEVKTSDCVIWAFPLYVLLVHANYKRFIELIWERGAQENFRGKYTALIATSIHFYDHTAVNYMHAVCDDLDMQYAGYYSADMDDLLDTKKRVQLVSFARNLFESASAKTEMIKRYQPAADEKISYIPTSAKSMDLKGQKTLVLTDSTDKSMSIGKMVERFAALTQADVIDISKISIKSSCIGCIQCGFDNECVFHGKDDIEETYEAMANYDIIVYAGAIKDRYLSARWKMFMDRRFFKTHQPHYTGKQVGYIISGPLSQNQNLLEIFEAMDQMAFSNFCGAITDEYTSSGEIDQRMDGLAKRMIDYSLQKFSPPQSFLGVGGFKIFRDDMWGRLRFPFRMDHRYYKKHGLYNFPQKNIKSRFQNSFMLLLINFSKIKNSIRPVMNKYMIKPYKEMLEKE
jgi:multimeric flavodoxin WrbA